MNRGNAWVGALVGLCLAAVVYLLITAPAGAAPPTSVVHTTLEDFNAGTLYHTGLTRNDDGEVQLLVVGLAGDWITETNTTGLPPLDRHTAVQHNGHILVLGGRDIDRLPTNQVYYTTIDPQTHDLADWATTTPLPNPPYDPGVYWHTSVVAHGRVYVLGGYQGSLNYGEVYFAPIQASGTLGTWQPTTPLPMPLRILKAALVDDTIYVVGGRDQGYEPKNEVYYATVDPGSGQLSAWQTTTPFVHHVYGHMIGVHENTIYVMGGLPLPPDEGGGVSPWVHHATAGPTHELSAWASTIDMSYNIYAGAGLSYNGQLYTTGGAINQVESPSAYVGASLIFPSGDVGSWVDTRTISPTRMWHASTHSDDGWLYVINGSDGTGPIDPPSINRGATAGAGDSYAAEGTFLSSEINLGESRNLVELKWNATITDTSLMTITVRYRTRLVGGDPWSAWQGPYPSSSTPGTVTTTLALVGSARYFQYEAFLGTNDTGMTPALNAVELISYKPTYDISLSKDAKPPPGSFIAPGAMIYYTLTYANDIWGMTAVSTTIVDEPPDHTDYVPGSIQGEGADEGDFGRLRWNLGQVLPGEVGTVSFAVQVTNQIPMGTEVVNTATITSTTGPARYSNRVTHLTEMPDLVLEVTKGAQPPPGSKVEPSSLITYAISYRNASLAYASQAMLTDTHDLHESYFVLSNDPPPNGGADNVWDLGALDPDDQGQITIVVQLTDTLPNNWIVTNRSSLKSPESTVTFTDEVTHLVSYQGVDLTDLVVEDIRWLPAVPQASEPVTFYATIANSGTKDADTWFYAALYIKPAPSDPPFGPSDHDRGYCMDDCSVVRPNYVHYIGTLPQGESIEVSFQGADVLFPTGGLYDVYVQIDVAFDDPHYNWYWGVFPEENEYNNSAHQVAVPESLYKYHLPILFRESP